MENKEEAVVYGSDVDELQRKEDTEQIKSLAEQVATQVFKNMLAAAVSTSNYSLWQEQLFNVTTRYIYANTDGQMKWDSVEYTLPTKDGFSPAAIRSAYAVPYESSTYGNGYFFGVYMYGYTARIYYGTDSTQGARLDIRLIVTYIRNNINIPTITIPQ